MLWEIVNRNEVGVLHTGAACPLALEVERLRRRIGIPSREGADAAVGVGDDHVHRTSSMGRCPQVDRTLHEIDAGRGSANASLAPG